MACRSLTALKSRASCAVTARLVMVTSPNSSMPAACCQRNASAKVFQAGSTIALTCPSAIELTAGALMQTLAAVCPEMMLASKDLAKAIASQTQPPASKVCEEIQRVSPKRALPWGNDQYDACYKAMSFKTGCQTCLPIYQAARTHSWQCSLVRPDPTSLQGYGRKQLPLDA